jgi:hypothetical protein
LVAAPVPVSPPDARGGAAGSANSPRPAGEELRAKLAAEVGGATAAVPAQLLAKVGDVAAVLPPDFLEVVCHAWGVFRARGRGSLRRPLRRRRRVPRRAEELCVA